MSLRAINSTEGGGQGGWTGQQVTDSSHAVFVSKPNQTIGGLFFYVSLATAASSIAST